MASNKLALVELFLSGSIASKQTEAVRDRYVIRPKKKLSRLDLTWMLLDYNHL